MSSVSCFICGSVSIQYRGYSVDYLVTREKFSLMECEKCGFYTTHPRPDETELGKYYVSDEYISHTDSKKGLIDKIYNVVRNYMGRKKARIALKYVVENKRIKPQLLDVGCGTGEFLLSAQKVGFEGLGFEPNQHAITLAKSKGVEVVSNEEHLQRFKQLKRFEVITLWHVLEHIPDLDAKIELLKDLLTENGVIIVAVPEYQSWDAKFYECDWAAWDVPRHLNHFSKKSLQTLFAKHNFYLIKKYPLIFDSFYISMLSESNKNKGVIGMIRAFFVGLLSNLWALTGKFPYSSQVYVFKSIKIEQNE